MAKEWKAFERRLKLNEKEKLESDCRGLVMEGNLFLQWVVSQEGNVSSCARMPTETIVPMIQPNGTFINPKRAYDQLDANGVLLTSFAVWQLTHLRLSPISSA